MTGSMTLQSALSYAELKHAGQVDKNGCPYIEHPIRVASYVDGETAKIVAVLHDVLEDTDATIDELRASGADDTIIEALSLLCHSDDQPYLQYIKAISMNPLAKSVKLADLADNTDEYRLMLLPEETRDRLVRKYRQAFELLNTNKADCDSQ